MAVIIRLPQRQILLFSVYAQGSDTEALRIAISNINQTISSERTRCSALDVIVAGDFNRHDILWGGTAVSDERQGEAEPIIEMMGTQRLINLLKCGAITRDRGGDASTIDLVLVSHGLANSMIYCQFNDTDYGSDHPAIVSSFNIEISTQMQVERLLFKEAPWQQIRETVSSLPGTSHSPAGTQEKCDRLIDAVSQAVQSQSLY